MMILIVEDNQGNADNFADICEIAGYSTISVSSCREAKGILETESVDLLICDLDLPDGNGLELIQLYKLPALLVTASVSSQTACLLQDSGIRFLIKPFGVSQFLQTLADFQI